jgi:hypothetical protein
MATAPRHGGNVQSTHRVTALSPLSPSLSLTQEQRDAGQLLLYGCSSYSLVLSAPDIVNKMGREQTPEVQREQQRGVRAQQVRQPLCTTGAENISASKLQTAGALGLHAAHQPHYPVGTNLPSQHKQETRLCDMFSAKWRGARRGKLLLEQRSGAQELSEQKEIGAIGIEAKRNVGAPDLELRSAGQEGRYEHPDFVSQVLSPAQREGSVTQKGCSHAWRPSW